MAWRGVLLSNPAQLSLDRNCCLVKGQDGPIRLAFEDMAYLVLDTPRALLTSALLARLAEENVLVITCDGRHLPTGALLPLQGHFRQTAALRLQLSAPPGLRRRLWQCLVAAKVLNQGRVLKLQGHAEAKAFGAMAERVTPGDEGQIEARAARIYFRLLFSDFRRRRADGDVRNAMLNYAYALLRAGLARALAAQGFHAAIGMNHDSIDNAFNLADDLIEPWRPIADLHVIRRLAARETDEMGEPSLSVADRRELARFLVADVGLKDTTTTVAAGLDRMVDGLYGAMDQRDPGLLPLPYPAE